MTKDDVVKKLSFIEERNNRVKQILDKDDYTYRDMREVLQLCGFSQHQFHDATYVEAFFTKMKQTLESKL